VTELAELAEFVLARVAEDEAKARSAEWVDKPPSGTFDVVSDCDCNDDHASSNYLAVDPARVLAECEKNRRLIELHHATEIGWGPDVIGCDTCHGEMPETWGPDLLAPGASLWPCETACLLALPYADHPDFQQAWRGRLSASAL
jgi:hypothetical protein